MGRISELNEITLSALAEAARMEDPYDDLRLNFGLSRQTVDLLRRVRTKDMRALLDMYGSTFMFNGPKVDENLRVAMAGIEGDSPSLSVFRQIACDKRAAA